MAPFSVIEHHDVVEQIGTRLLSRAIVHMVHSLTLEDSKEALDDAAVRPSWTRHSRPDRISPQTRD